MATIREIAQKAGVSRGTVDRVLNNRGAVNQETKEKVLAVAKSLNYRPNKAGIILAAQRKKLKLGVVMYGANHPFFDVVEKGVRRKAEELAAFNCTVLIRRFENGIDGQLEVIRELLEENIDGLAIAPLNAREIAECLREVTNRGIPVVTLNSDINNSGRIAYVGSNYFLSGQTAAGLMYRMAPKDIKCGIVSGFDNVLCHTERIAGFYDRIQKEYHNIEVVDTVYNCDNSSVSYDITLELLAKHPEINAIFLAAGGVSGTCKAICSLGRQDDIFIVAHDRISNTPDFVRKNVIDVVICQQAELQGELPLEILFSYLTTGEPPENEFNYVQVDIRIKENL